MNALVSDFFGLAYSFCAFQMILFKFTGKCTPGSPFAKV